VPHLGSRSTSNAEAQSLQGVALGRKRFYNTEKDGYGEKTSARKILQVAGGHCLQSYGTGQLASVSKAGYTASIR